MSKTTVFTNDRNQALLNIFKKDYEIEQMFNRDKKGWVNNIINMFKKEEQQLNLSQLLSYQVLKTTLINKREEKYIIIEGINTRCDNKSSHNSKYIKGVYKIEPETLKTKYAFWENVLSDKVTNIATYKFLDTTGETLGFNHRHLIYKSVELKADGLYAIISFSTESEPDKTFWLVTGEL